MDFSALESRQKAWQFMFRGRASSPSCELIERQSSTAR
jgi:hypothetical protein